jgi:hypothetical protein
MRKALLVLCVLLSLLGIAMFFATTALMLDPLQLETPAPRPGAQWIAHVEVWRAILVLLLLAVVILVLCAAALTLARSRVDELASGARERLVLGMLDLVFVLGFLALFPEADATIPELGRLPAQAIAALRIIGLLLVAGLIISARLGRTPGSHVARRAAQAGPPRSKTWIVVVALCLLIGAGVYADISSVDSAMFALPPANLVARPLPTRVLVALSDGFGWASTGFSTFSASNPDLPIATSGATCVPSDCIVVGAGSGGDEVLGIVRGSSIDWRSQVLPTNYPLPFPLSCLSNLVCIGQSQLDHFALTRDGGEHWSSVGLPSNIQASLANFGTTGSCVSAWGCTFLGIRVLPLAAQRRCTCEGQPVVVSSLGTSHEPQVHLIPGVDIALYGLSCTTARTCLAVGEDKTGAGLIMRTDDGGSTWEQSSLATGTPPILQIACAGAQNCVAVGGAVLPNLSATAPMPGAVILTTTDAGISWNLERPVLGGTVLSDVACTPSGDCLVMGESFSPGSAEILPAGTMVALATTDAGRQWVRLPVPVGRFSTTGVSCGVSNCVVTAEHLEPGPPRAFFLAEINWNMSPASTGIVLVWAPTVGLRMISTPALPPDVVEPLLRVP